MCYKSSVGMLSCVSSVLPWHFFFQKSKNPKDMTSPKRKAYFKTFLKLWNKKKLPQVLCVIKSEFLNIYIDCCDGLCVIRANCTSRHYQSEVKYHLFLDLMMIFIEKHFTTDCNALSPPQPHPTEKNPLNWHFYPFTGIALRTCTW